MSVEKWLESQRSESTKRVYMAGLRAFTRVIGVDVEQYLVKLKSGRDPFPDLLKFASYLADKPPKTANAYMQGVMNFLEYTVDLELSKKQRHQLRNRMPRGKRARTVEDDLTRERLRKILAHCDTKAKALFLFLVSSGIRVGEALQLTFDDVDLKSTPVKVNVRGEYTKTGDKYYSFISREAQEALTEWLKVREQYLKLAAKRTIGLGKKTTEDKRIFPFSYQVACFMWNNALRKAGLENHDKGTNRHTLHIHMLRKFFNSQLKGEAKLPKEIVDALMGHNEGLTVAYRRFTKDNIKKWYLKGEPYLTISMPQEIRELRQTYDNRIEDLQTIVNGLTAKNLTLEQKVEDFEKWMRDKATEVFREEWRQYLIYLGEEDQKGIEGFLKWQKEREQKGKQKK